MQHRPPALGAGVAYYGAAPEPGRLTTVRAPVLGLYGENDARVNATIAPTDSAARLSALGADVFFGSARFTSRRTIAVDETVDEPNAANGSRHSGGVAVLSFGKAVIEPKPTPLAVSVFVTALFEDAQYLRSDGTRCSDDDDPHFEPPGSGARARSSKSI